MKRKGFTLIELLAVIIILAIIAVIAVPTIMNIITKARRSAFKDSVYGLIKSGELYYSQRLLNNGLENDVEIVFPSIGELQIKGDMPVSGNMIISKDGDIAIAASNGKYCVRKGYQDTDVTIDEDIKTCKTTEIANATMIENITVDNEDITIKQEQSIVVNATIEPTTATNQKLEWISNNPLVATVTNEGKVTGISIGSTEVIVRSTDGSGISKTINVKVKSKIYQEEILNGAYPVLGSDLIPVTIDNNGKVTYADITEEWYNYNEQKWANAVILKSGSSYSVGQEIPEDSIESYFVWVPKYSYQLFDMGNYTTYIEGKPTTSNVKTINIKFGLNNTNDTNTNECTTPMTSGASGNCKVGDYMTHPAFISMNTNGLWVGKFETSTDDICQTNSTVENCNKEHDLIVKPNVPSLRNISVMNMFNSAYKYKRSSDSHMMKNTEWGAVAYLSHSKYGINKEININNNSSFLTGYSAVVEKDQSKYPGISGIDSSVTLPYNTETGYKASSTENITGVYDLSGGVQEYMASYVNGQLGLSGFDTAKISSYDSKYFDVYSELSNITNYNYRILGDATGEMGPFYNYKDTDNNFRYHNNWYDEHSGIVDSSYSWFTRGGNYYEGIIAGQFYFGRNKGASTDKLSFRIVLSIN